MENLSSIILLTLVVSVWLYVIQKSIEASRTKKIIIVLEALNVMVKNKDFAAFDDVVEGALKIGHTDKRDDMIMAIGEVSMIKRSINNK